MPAEVWYGNGSNGGKFPELGTGGEAPIEVGKADGRHLLLDAGFRRASQPSGKNAATTSRAAWCRSRSLRTTARDARSTSLRRW